MVKRIKNKLTKKRIKKSQKPVGLIYYKMNQCKYCKSFEKELWKKIVKYCNKKDIKTHMRMKKKIEEKKNTLPSHILDAMKMTLDLMEETVGTEQFRLYRSALLNLSKGYNIFFRGRKK